jgi:oligopeptide/dipeptide ABC transporter ATP-binding protein
MNERVLTVEDLAVELPVPAGLLRAVQSVSFHVDRGETLCIVGESGCGKTLTALAVMNLLPARAKRAARRIELEGRELGDLSERAMANVRGNRMAMIFQEPMTSLNPAYTIGNQLEEALLRHRRMPRRAARERAVYLLDRVGIRPAANRLKQYPHQLSGGLRQRVMIAMALMCSPALILADEPTMALDVTIQAQILHLLAELQREFAMGLVLITHDLGIVGKSIGSIIALPLRVQGKSRPDTWRGKVEDMMERVGLARSLYDNYPSQLSGGQRQRVAIARALINHPRMVICDEPTSALDVSVQSQILNLLQDLRRDLGLTYLLISHNLAVVEHMATRVAVMYLGRIVEEAETESFFRAPLHPYSAALLGSVLTPEPGLGVPAGELGAAFADPLNPPAGCRFHPRCGRALARCARVAPLPVVAAGSFVECHLHDRQQTPAQQG